MKGGFAFTEIERKIGLPPPQMLSIHPLKSLYEACKLLVEARAHRLPLVDVDSDTGQEMIVSVLTQYRILKFIAVNVSYSWQGDQIGLDSLFSERNDQFICDTLNAMTILHVI